MVEAVQKIGVVGAGTMGAGVAQTFAAPGFSVTMRDIAQAPLDRGMGAIRKSLDRLVARGKLPAPEKDATFGRIKATTSIDDLADCDVVVEAVLERFDLKKAVMADLDRSAGPTRSSPPTPLRSPSPGSPRPPRVQLASSACISSIRRR